MLAKTLLQWSEAGADAVILMRAATQDHRSPVRAPRVGTRPKDQLGGPRSYVAIFALSGDLEELEQLARRIDDVAQRDAEGLPPGLYPYALRFRCGLTDVARVPMAVQVLEKPAADELQDDAGELEDA